MMRIARFLGLVALLNLCSENTHPKGIMASNLNCISKGFAFGAPRYWTDAARATSSFLWAGNPSKRGNRIPVRSVQVNSDPTRRARRAQLRRSQAEAKACRSVKY